LPGKGEVTVRPWGVLASVPGAVLLKDGSAEELLPEDLECPDFPSFSAWLFLPSGFLAESRTFDAKLSSIFSGNQNDPFLPMT